MEYLKAFGLLVLFCVACVIVIGVISLMATYMWFAITVFGGVLIGIVYSACLDIVRS